MIATCLGHGLKGAAKRPALTTLLWGINLALGLLAAIPAWTWWRDSFSYAPAADTLLSAFNFAAYGDIGHYNRAAVSALLTTSVVAMVVVAGVLGALVFGGMLEILRSSDSRPFMHRFFRGAGHFFWRFLRLAIYTAIAAALATGLLAAALVPLLKPLDDSAWEPGWLVASAIRFVVIGAVLLIFLLALDYARIRVAVDDTRRAFRTWIASLGFVLRRVPATFGIVIVFAFLYAVLLAAYVGYCAVAPVDTRLWILMLVGVQQVVMWLRVGVRVASVGAEIDFFEQRRPARAAAVPVIVPPVSGDAPPAPTGPDAPGPITNTAEAPSEHPKTPTSQQQP
jgi:hypothetical protein